MELLLETIKLQNGQLPFLPYHQQRITRSWKFHFGKGTGIQLEKAIKIPTATKHGIFKLRILYGEKIEQVAIIPYQARPVEALQLVDIHQLSYTHKYANRQALQTLFQQRTYGDDILMVRNGLLTDTSYANVALFDGTAWYTPTSPLLAGTARQRLLETGLIQTANIPAENLSDFEEIRLINAMMDWGEGPRVDVDRVRW